MKFILYPLAVPEASDLRKRSITESLSDLEKALTTAKECRDMARQHLGVVVDTLDDIIRRRRKARAGPPPRRKARRRVR